MKKIIVVAVAILLIISGLIYIKNNKINEEISSSSKPYINDIDKEENFKKDDKEETSNRIIGNLQIEKINLNAPIKEGSTQKVLKDYIGHIEETPIYNGNVCLAAHNRGNKHSYFSRINELKEGDEITYNTDIYSKKYLVTSIKEIEETDWSMLEDCNEDKLTLITCVKNKKDKRLCVQAVQI